jgi:hypothetical protein
LVDDVPWRLFRYYVTLMILNATGLQQFVRQSRRVDRMGRQYQARAVAG